MRSVGQHHAAQSGHLLAAHGFPDDRERFNANGIVWDQVIWAVVKPLINVRERHEAVDFNRVVAFDLDGLKLLILNDENAIPAP